MIKINNDSLAKAINVQLSFLGNNKDYDEFEYTEDEIDSITSIILINPKSIDDIDKLKNLNRLSIGYSNILDIENYQINTELLSQLINLQSLTIINNIFIKSIDLSCLKKLENVQLINSPFLEEIRGLDQINNLKQVKFVGNKVRDVDGFLDFVQNNSELEEAIFDVLSYPKISNYLPDVKTSREKIKFAEKISFGELYVTNADEMAKVQDIAIKIVQQIATNKNLDVDIQELYRYVVTHLIYDYDGLNERNEYFISHQYKPLIQNELMNKYRLMNTSIHAFLNGCVICEAYVNELIYLYNLIMVTARVIRVKERSSNSLHCDHAAMCFEYNNRIYFSDPQKEDDFTNLNKLFYEEEDFRKIYIIDPLDEIIIKKWGTEINDKIIGNIKGKK